MEHACNSGLTANTAIYGGRAYFGWHNNCTLTANFAARLLVAAPTPPRLTTALSITTTLPRMPTIPRAPEYCCATPLPDGPGNLQSEPQLVSASHLNEDSPCRGAGSSA